MNEVDVRLHRIEEAILFLTDALYNIEGVSKGVQSRIHGLLEEKPDLDGPYDDPTRAPRMSGMVHSLQGFRCDSRNPLTNNQCCRLRGHGGFHETTNGQSPVVNGTERWTG